MRFTHILSFAALAAMALVSNLSAQTNAFQLTLEQSTDGLRSWQRVPMSAAMLSNGDIALATASTNAFYRIKIAKPAPTPPPDAWPEAVTFDNPLGSTNNDLSLYFSVVGDAFSWVPTGGTTGGAIQPKAWISWGNAFASFGQAFTSSVGQTLRASVDFYYDPSLINPNQFQRPVGIYFESLNAYSSDISFYIDPPYQSVGPSTLQIVTYSWIASNTGTAGQMSLSSGWHRLSVSASIIGGSFGDEIFVESQVFHLGSDGLQTPNIVAVSRGTFYDAGFPNSSVRIKIHAAQWGGARLLDNFSASQGATPSPTPAPSPSPPPPVANMVTVQGGILPQSSALAGTAVAAFQINKYEVTYDEWQKVRAWAVANGYPDLAETFLDGTGRPPGLGSAGNHPVHSVNWYDTLKWCNARSEAEGLVPVYRLDGAVYRAGVVNRHATGLPRVDANPSANGYRLPTEAEWEWAARGGANSQAYTYSGSNDPGAVAWYYHNSSGAVVAFEDGRGTWPVGTKTPNELGIYDMTGNLQEWCEDRGPTDMGFDSRRLRGGDWRTSDQPSTSDGIRYLDVATRLRTIPDNRTYHFGFRLARKLEP